MCVCVCVCMCVYTANEGIDITLLYDHEASITEAVVANMICKVLLHADMMKLCTTVCSPELIIL